MAAGKPRVFLQPHHSPPANSFPFTNGSARAHAVTPWNRPAKAGPKPLALFAASGSRSAGFLQQRVRSEKRGVTSELTHGKMLPKAGDHQVFVDSRSRLPSAVKIFFNLTSMLFFSSKGSSAACSARSCL